MNILKSLNTSLKTIKTDEKDQGLVALARTLAAAIDSGEGDLDRLASRLLATLDHLQMTPKSRGQQPDEPTTSTTIDELRAKRANKRVTGT